PDPIGAGAGRRERQTARRVPPRRATGPRHADVRHDRRADGGHRRFSSQRDLSEFQPPPLQDSRHCRRRSESRAGVFHRRGTVYDATEGLMRSWLRNGNVPKVVVTDPLQAHLDHLSKWTDAEMHNMTAYLASLK